MKLNLKLKKQIREEASGYKIGYKVVRKFALFPIRINNSQLAWLEWVYIIKEYDWREEVWSDISDAYDSYKDKLFTNKQGYKKYKAYLKSTNFYPDSLGTCRRS